MEWEPSDTGHVTILEKELPGCCSVNVLHEAEFQDKGTAFTQALKECLEEHNFDNWGDAGLMLYTLDEDQGDEHAGLKANGFEALTTYVSPSTGKTITVYGLKINQPEKAPTRAVRLTRRRRARA